MNDFQTIDRRVRLVDMDTPRGRINMDSLILHPLTLSWASIKHCRNIIFEDHGYLTWTAMTATTKLRNSLLAILVALLVGRWLIYSIGKAFGLYLKRKTAARRQSTLKRVRIEEEAVRSFYRRSQKSEDDDWEKIESYGAATSTNGSLADSDWEGIVGFFHPFWFVGLIYTRSKCLLIKSDSNAGGGGERVLWAAIRATQKRWPKAVCVVYTGDHDATKPSILERVKVMSRSFDGRDSAHRADSMMQNRFNIQLHPPTVVFIYLSTRDWVLSSKYPHFTLLGQSFGSLILGYDAFSLLVPDIFIDTMGYAFTLALCKFFFPEIPTGAYVHYPTISTDMLGSLDAESGRGLNAGLGKGWKGTLKRWYWHFFAWMYCWVGGTVDVVMTNSTWTQGHIRSLWGPNRRERNKSSNIEVVFPPVAVEELEQAIEISESSEARREKALLYVAQFRPEKNHVLILRAFSQLLQSNLGDAAKATQDVKLVLVGSVRDDEDKRRVYSLRLLAYELKIKDQVEFICDAPWSDILDWLRRSWVGVNGMWNEHFGIGVVEYQAAGLISVVNDSGGPKEDIVVDWDGGPTGKLHNLEMRGAS